MSRTEELSNALIKDVTSHMQGNVCVLNWHWAESVPCVYVYKSRFDTPFDPDQINEKDMKLYTREEYKVHRGYREYIAGYGRYTYRIFPCQLQNGRPVMLIPDGEDHIIHVSSGKAKIYYSFKKGKKWFSQYQTLQIRIFSEILIPKEALCYVKKKALLQRIRMMVLSMPLSVILSRERTLCLKSRSRKRLHSPLFYRRKKIWAKL
ncbi:beta-mannanase [Brevibacillus laterosporus]